MAGWETEEEEDLWDVDFDFLGSDPESKSKYADADLTVAELMEWRYLRAEREKEQVSTTCQHVVLSRADATRRETWLSNVETTVRR